MSDNPEKRLNALSTTVGGKLELMYETKCVNDAKLFEYHLHEHFKDYRTTGEWFKIDSETAVQYIKSVEHEFNSAEYKNLIAHLEPDRECVVECRYLDYIDKQLTEIEDFIYRDDNHYYYIKYKQGRVIMGVKFCNLSIARKFKKENPIRLLKINQVNKHI